MREKFCGGLCHTAGENCAVEVLFKPLPGRLDSATMALFCSARVFFERNVRRAGCARRTGFADVFARGMGREAVVLISEVASTGG